MTDRFILGVPLGRWQTNCYLIGDRDTGRAVIIDPGEGATKVVNDLLSSLELTLDGILLTHGHIDHLWSIPELARQHETPVLLHPLDRWLFDNPAATFGGEAEVLIEQFGLDWDPPTAYLRDINDHDTLHIANTSFRVAHTPGHTPGSVTFLIDDTAATPLTFALAGVDETPEKVLFSGDLLFQGSVGRTDFPRGSTEDLLEAIATRVMTLPDDTLVLAGHGPDTTVGEERATNPFLR